MIIQGFLYVSILSIFVAPAGNNWVLPFSCIYNVLILPVLLPLARYSWCSERVIQDSASTEDNVTPDDLIPLESNSGVGSSCTRDQHPALVIGHNVGFDRSFVKEQYWLQVTMYIQHFTFLHGED